MNNLVVVESPTKARTLSQFLGSGYQIVASMGHIRDLPKAEFGIDVEHNFEPTYVIPRDKKKRVNQLKKELEEAKILWLATDPDREGEAIAWHITELLRNSELKIKNLKFKIEDIKRVVFHEITKDAITEAFKHPRGLNRELIDAQQARRVLDRLVGYKLSPLLWKKVKRGLSAGRVQTVALSLVVEREKEIEKFKPIEYWSIEAELGIKSEKLKAKNRFVAGLVELNGKKVEIKNEKQAQEHLKVLEEADYQVAKVTKKEVYKYPAPPFTTSTLQQASGVRLGLSAKRTMMIAQDLYEKGLITYMRTDSVTLSNQAIFSIRNLIEKEYGKNYLPQSPKFYKTKSKLAQEAHEAIRPTDVKFQISNFKFQIGLTRDHVRLYDLIWKRAVASQMEDAIFDQTIVDVKAEDYLLRASGSIIKFDGWLKLEAACLPARQGGWKVEAGEEEEKQKLPELFPGQNLNLLELLPKQHFTQASPRYTEATLIKKLEELGIGRPSTYAPTLSTIQERLYVEKTERKFKPTELGITVCDFLIKYFPDVFDYKFTALMEDSLDDVAKGEKKWQGILADFYFPFEKKVQNTQDLAQKVKIEPEYVDKNCPLCGSQLVVRIGKFGKFLACSKFPECKHTESFEQTIDIPCPKDGGVILLRRTKKGKPFYGCKNWPKCTFASWTKPKVL